MTFLSEIGVVSVNIPVVPGFSVGRESFPLGAYQVNERAGRRPATMWTFRL